MFTIPKNIKTSLDLAYRRVSKKIVFHHNRIVKFAIRSKFPELYELLNEIKDPLNSSTSFLPSSKDDNHNALSILNEKNENTEKISRTMATYTKRKLETKKNNE